MTVGRKSGRLVAVAAVGLMAASAGAAVAQTTATTTPVPNQVQPGATPEPSTTIAPTPTPQNYTRFNKAPFTNGLKPKSVTAAFQMTKDETAPTRAFTGPTSMLPDPENPRVVVSGVANLRTRICQLLVSTNAGRTWHFSKALPAPASYPFCTSTMSGVPEVSLAWGRNHTLYYGLMAYDIVSGQEGPRDGRASIALARTTNLGDTWKTTLAENNRGKAPEPGGGIISATGVTGISVDTSGPRDIVSLGYSRGYTNAPSGSPLNDPKPMVATSTDGGDTFAPAVNLNDFTNLTRQLDRPYKIVMRTGFGAPYLTAHNGTILAVAGSDFTNADTPTPPHSAGQGLTPGTFYAYPNPQLVARSTDQGKTWQVKELGPPIYAGTGSMTGLGWTPKGGANGTFIAVYAGTPDTSSTTGIADTVVQRSTDGGQTWTPPLAISDDKPDQEVTNFYPQVGIAPNGRVDAVWLDNRDVGDYRFHVRYSSSTDGGVSWAPNVQVDDRPVDYNFGISYNSDLRYPPGVASSNYYAAVGWTDTRGATADTQTQDDYGSVVVLSALPATTNTTAPVIAAIFGGLIAAGIVLLVLLAVRRRRTGTTTSRVDQRNAVRT